MRKLTNIAGLALAGFVLGFAGHAAAQEMVVTDYIRKDKDTINVFVKDGGLYCNRASDKFEMCHGMSKDGDAWKGKKMKHPDMPGFMTFNGTVTTTEDTLTIKGCAVGNSMCDTEVWTKKPAEEMKEGEMAEPKDGEATETKASE